MAWQVSWALWATVFRPGSRRGRAVTGGRAEPGEVRGPLSGPCPHPFCPGFPPHPTPRLRWLQGLSPHTPLYRGGDTGQLGAGPGGTWQALLPPAACPGPGSGREEVTACWGAGCLDQGHTERRGGRGGRTRLWPWETLLFALIFLGNLRLKSNWKLIFLCSVALRFPGCNFRGQLASPEPACLAGACHVLADPQVPRGQYLGQPSWQAPELSGSRR